MPTVILNGRSNSLRLTALVAPDGQLLLGEAEPDGLLACLACAAERPDGWWVARVRETPAPAWLFVVRGDSREAAVRAVVTACGDLDGACVEILEPLGSVRVL